MRNQPIAYALLDLSKQIEPEEVEFTYDHPKITTCTHVRSGVVLFNCPAALPRLESLALWNLGREAAYAQARAYGRIEGEDEIKESLANLLGYRRESE